MWQRGGGGGVSIGMDHASCASLPSPSPLSPLLKASHKRHMGLLDCVAWFHGGLSGFFRPDFPAPPVPDPTPHPTGSTTGSAAIFPPFWGINGKSCHWTSDQSFDCLWAFSTRDWVKNLHTSWFCEEKKDWRLFYPLGIIIKINVQWAFWKTWDSPGSIKNKVFRKDLGIPQFRDDH